LRASRKERIFFNKKNYGTGAWGEIEKDRKFIKGEQTGASRFIIKITVLEYEQKLNKDIKIVKGEQTNTNKFPDKRETKPE
jgi:hypothetical protein